MLSSTTCFSSNNTGETYWQLTQDAEFQHPCSESIIVIIIIIIIIVVVIIIVIIIIIIVVVVVIIIIVIIIIIIAYYVYLFAGSIAMPAGNGVASCPPATLVAVGKTLQMHVSSPLADLQTPLFAASQRYSSMRCWPGILLEPTADWRTHGLDL